MRRLAAVLALGLVAAACGSDDADDSATTDTTAVSADSDSSADTTAGEDAGEDSDSNADDGDDATPSAGGTLRIAMGSDAQTLDPPNFRINADTVRMSMLFDRLVNLAEDGTVVPELATEWEQLDDVTWEFQLREGVAFHDGTDFNAAAVELVLERSKAQDQGAAYLSVIDDVEVISDYVVQLHLSRPFAAILNNLAVPVSGIYSPASVEEFGDQVGQHPVGTGPYQFSEWQVDTMMVFERNAEYWGEAPPIDRVEWIPIPEPSTRLSALRAGEVDVIENPPPDEIANFDSYGITALIEPKARPIFLGINIEAVPDLAVREAIAHAINKDIIVEAILEGIGSPANDSLVTPSFREGQPAVGLAYDVEAAKALIAEAGAEGTTLRLVVPTERYLRDTQVAEVIQAQLAEIGITLELDIRDTGAWYQALLDRDTELYWLGWGLTTYEPGDLFARVFATDQVNNMSQLSSPEVDELVGQLEITPVGTTERADLITQLERLVVEDNVAVVPVYHAANLFAVRDGVEGFHVTAGELVDISEVTVGE